MSDKSRKIAEFQGGQQNVVTLSDKTANLFTLKQSGIYVGIDVLTSCKLPCWEVHVTSKSTGPRESKGVCDRPWFFWISPFFRMKSPLFCHTPKRPAKWPACSTTVAISPSESWCTWQCFLRFLQFLCHQPSLATKSWIPVQTKWSWKHLIITWLSWNRRTSREFEAAPPARCLRADSHPKKNICGRQRNSNPHSNDSPFVNGFLSPQIIHFKPSLK